jgi:hypothetical protein
LERYASRFDGGVAFCAVAGTAVHIRYAADYFAAAAYTAGVSQSDLETTGIRGVIATVRDRLADERIYTSFQTLVERLTGGARPFVADGLRSVREAKLGEIDALGSAGLLDNRYSTYADVDGAFHRAAIRFGPVERDWEVGGRNEFGGHLGAPLLTVHGTGDFVVPLIEAMAIRRKADQAGTRSRLVQRTVQSPAHCDFTEAEFAESFEALVSWVENGREPSGEDLLRFDGATLGRDFTRQAR